MTFEDKLAWLKSSCERASKTLIEDAYSVRYERKKKSLGAVLSSMASNHERLGVYAYFAESNLAEMKQHFYVVAKLNIASVGLRWGETLSSTTDFLYIMLSDSPEVIKAYASLEPEEYLKNRENPRVMAFLVHMYQLALRGEHDALRVKIAIAAQKSGQKLREEFSAGEDFFSLLLKRDKSALEALITKKANQWQAIIKKGGETGTPLSENLMASIAMEYAKLCWLKGIEVEIDHPLIPMELLPIKPLTHYDDVYDFLDPNWQPPPQGFIDKVANFFKR